jgi:phage host-nuclease inhibitor protein Gam
VSTVNGSTPQAIEAEIAQQRDELAATVDELQYRLDVPARAKERPLLLGGIAATAVVLVGLVIWRKSHS